MVIKIHIILLHEMLDNLLFLYNIIDYTFKYSNFKLIHKFASCVTVLKSLEELVKSNFYTVISKTTLVYYYIIMFSTYVKILYFNPFSPELFFV